MLSNVIVCSVLCIVVEIVLQKNSSVIIIRRPICSGYMSLLLKGNDRYSLALLDGVEA